MISCLCLSITCTLSWWSVWIDSHRTRSMYVEALSNHAGYRLQGPLLITPRLFSDHRGFFYESWNERRFRSELINLGSQKLRSNLWFFLRIITRAPRGAFSAVFIISCLPNLRASLFVAVWELFLM